MEELCRRFDETINLAVLDGTQVAYLADGRELAMRCASPRDLATPISSTRRRSARRSPRRLSAEELQRMLTIEGMPAITPRTITELSEFPCRAGERRRQGYAVNDLENDNVGRCVAVVTARAG